jgi:hypothetical protein
MSPNFSVQKGIGVSNMATLLATLPVTIYVGFRGNQCTTKNNQGYEPNKGSAAYFFSNETFL